jgi:hypothetical protein
MPHSVGEVNKQVRYLRLIHRCRAGFAPSSFFRKDVAFRKRLNALGWERKSREPEQVRDVDATAPLSDGEYYELMREYRALVA